MIKKSLQAAVIIGLSFSVYACGSRDFSDNSLEDPGLAVDALDPDDVKSYIDPESGCVYLLTWTGGITPKLSSNGLPDCPAAVEAINGR